MRMPNGKYTDDEIEYCDAWDAFAKPIAEATGTELAGFDPRITLSGEHGVVQLPEWFVERFNEFLENDCVKIEDTDDYGRC